MAHIAIFVTWMDYDSGNLAINGEVRWSGGATSASWSTSVAFDAASASINSAIKNAAITAAEAAGSGTVGALDSKTLYAGAMGL
jgi:hypothetical protein